MTSPTVNVVSVERMMSEPHQVSEGACDSNPECKDCQFAIRGCKLYEHRQFRGRLLEAMHLTEEQLEVAAPYVKLYLDISDVEVRRDKEHAQKILKGLVRDELKACGRTEQEIKEVLDVETD
jgi:hypothetical protein